jgi:hypothetical protein
LLAAEIAKRDVAPEAQLSNWLAHDLGRSPARNRKKWPLSQGRLPEA